MILLMDVGNDKTVVGISQGDKIIDDFEFSTDERITADELLIKVYSMLKIKEIDPLEIKDSIFSSVVPSLNKKLGEMLFRITGIKALEIIPGVKTGLNIKIDNPRELGSDLLASSVAAYNIYKRSALIIDFGSVTTLCFVDNKGNYQGGLILPGPYVMEKALRESAVKLPGAHLEKGGRLIAKTTEESMKSGLYYGYTSMVESLILRIKKEIDNEFGYEPLVVATGEYNGELLEEISSVDEKERNLTLKGLKIIYDRNRK